MQNKEIYNTHHIHFKRALELFTGFLERLKLQII